MNLLRFLPVIGISILTAGHASTDWPMWRHDPGRTAATEEQLPEKLFLQWTLKLPSLVPAYKDLRLQFDKGYEPIVSNGRLIIGSSRSGAVTAYDAEKAMSSGGFIPRVLFALPRLQMVIESLWVRTMDFFIV